MVQCPRCGCMWKIRWLNIRGRYDCPQCGTSLKALAKAIEYSHYRNVPGGLSAYTDHHRWMIANRIKPGRA